MVAGHRATVQVTEVSALSLEDRVGLDAATRSTIEAELLRHTMLDRVIKWGFACEPPRVVTNVVVQDEYTHDVVIPWGGGLFLVYDCT